MNVTITERLVNINTAEAWLKEQERQIKLILVEKLPYKHHDIIEYGSESRRKKGVIVDFILWRTYTDIVAIPRVYQIKRDGTRTLGVKPVAIPQYEMKNVKIVKRAQSRWV